MHSSWIRAPILESPHAFTTRAGGVSRGPYATLNLSLGVGDVPEHVAENRRRVLAAFGNPPSFGLDQVHGHRVVVAEGPGVAEGDGAVTDVPGLLLRVSTADCYPLLFEDPDTGAVGAAHAGWRGVAAGIVENLVGTMREAFGTEPARLRVAIGPGICGRCYQVGPEVARAVGGFAVPDPRAEGRFLLDLAAAIEARLRALGVRHLWRANRCTFEDEGLFSYRRQGPRSGRMWGVIQRAL